MLVTETDSLGLILRTHTVGRKNQLLQVFLWLPHGAVAHACDPLLVNKLKNVGGAFILFHLLKFERSYRERGCVLESVDGDEVRK